MRVQFVGANTGATIDSTGRQAETTNYFFSGTAWTASTFFGGNGDDEARGIAIGPVGVYLVGTQSYFSQGVQSASTFPLVDPMPVYPEQSIPQTAFVSRLSTNAQTLTFSTLLGGYSSDAAVAVALDSGGNAYVAGYTNDSGFPTANFYTTPGAADRTVNDDDGFVIKLENRSVVPVPSPRIYQAVDWNVRASVSSEDGLVIDNATLGQRLMAQQISLPYLRLTTNKINSRMELRPNKTISGLARSQLIGLWDATETGLVGANGAIIPGYLSLLAVDPQAATQLVPPALAAAGRSERLINNLLDASRVQAHQYTLFHRPVAIADIFAALQRIAPGLACYYTDPPIDVRFTVIGQPVIEGDATQIERALLNLLDNALAFSPPEGYVRLRAWATTASCIIEISDDGPGIPADIAYAVLHRTPVIQRGRQRTGLGLRQAIDAVRAHGGELSFAVPKGTTVRIELPLLGRRS